MQVSEIMTKNPACCTPDSMLSDVARMMKENDCGCIPVVNNRAEMKPVGTITDRDITIRTVADNHNPMNMKASDIMTTDIAAVAPETSLEECFDVMEDREIRRVLVVDENGKCCGIVAQADVVQSGASPVRTNKVIREISESNPSRNRRAATGGEQSDYESYAGRQSLISGRSLLPLLIGLGSGAALMYLMDSRQRSDNDRRQYRSGRLNADIYESENLADATNEVSFGKYADAEREIEKRQHDLEDRFQALRSESDSPLNAATTTKSAGADFSFNKEDKTPTADSDKSRTANSERF